MPAYVLVFAAILSRLMPHAGWFNFTAVGGSLLYFGARRSRWEMLAAAAALAATDFYLTVFTYHYGFAWQSYLPTWAWYGAAMMLGRILLAKQTTLARFGSAVVLAPGTFFLVSNYAAWLTNIELYPRSLAGLMMSYTAGLPFYGRDMVSTAIVAGLAFGLPVLARLMRAQQVAVTH